jgi:hypothetical protein
MIARLRPHRRAAPISGLDRIGALFERFDLVDQLRLRHAKAALPERGWFEHMPLLAKRLFEEDFFTEEDVTTPR